MVLLFVYLVFVKRLFFTQVEVHFKFFLGVLELLFICIIIRH